jgi:hypothetical protein
MNIQTILHKAWQMLWRYRALWFFGAVLALVGANAIYPPSPSRDWENNDQWIKIKLSEYTTLRVPGADATIDFTAPEGVRITPPDKTSWRDFRDLVNLVNREASINLWPILIEFVVILAGLLLLGMIARYITETALMRMVNEAEETGKHLSLWEGLRKGFSIRAGRLFVLDLTVSVLAAVAIIIMFGLALAPSLLAIGSHDAVLITAGVGTAGLIILGFYLWLAASAVLSLVMQPIRRICVLEDQGLFTSVRQGITLTKHHLKDIVPLWLVWMGIRLLWVPLGLLILILLAPVLLLTTLVGVVVGGVPAALVGGISGLLMPGVTPWIMGALAGVPILFVVVVSPMLFVSGLVEIYKSTIWTLGYRDLKAKENLVQVPLSQAPLVATHSPAD